MRQRKREAREWRSSGVGGFKEWESSGRRKGEGQRSSCVKKFKELRGLRNRKALGRKELNGKTGKTEQRTTRKRDGEES